MSQLYLLMEEPLGGWMDLKIDFVTDITAAVKFQRMQSSKSSLLNLNR